jgi:hypothetical protein
MEVAVGHNLVFESGVGELCKHYPLKAVVVPRVERVPMGLPATKEVQFARGTTRTAPMCAEEQRAIDGSD